jgi:carbonic anhydrase/acetyltransferase-like protein (isoleucine patch superfamily)
MRRRRMLMGVVGFIAALAAPVAFAAQTLFRPFVRLCRLVSLRAQTDGLVPVTTQFDGPARVLGTGKVSFGDGCRLGRDVQFETRGSGEIVIAEHVRINTGCVVVANARVCVGADTLIGEYVSIRDTDHGMSPCAPMRLQQQVTGDIHIGRDVWIGRGSCILKGVTVGDGVVIGANSVVTRDLPANSICAGAPAKQIGTRGPIASPG